MVNVFSNPFGVAYFTTENELVLASSDLGLLKASINQMRAGESLGNDVHFSKALSASGKNVEANILVNFEKLPAYLTGALKPKSGCARVGS